MGIDKQMTDIVYAELQCAKSAVGTLRFYRMINQKYTRAYMHSAIPIVHRGDRALRQMMRKRVRKRIDKRGAHDKIVFDVRTWRNGIRNGLKIRRGNLRGSNPLVRTIFHP